MHSVKRSTDPAMSRLMPTTLALVAAASVVLVPACRGCRSGPAAPPTRFIARDAAGVVEIRDLGVLARERAHLPALLAGLATPEQLDAAEQELTATLGFDPATGEGLESAGLPREGAVAIELGGSGDGALWVVPVRDQERFGKTVERIARARASVDGVEKATIAGKDAVVLAGTFGPDKVTVAAYAFDQGYGLVGVGPKARAMLERGLAVKAGEDVTANAEYAALVRDLGTSWQLRLIAPRAGGDLGAALARLGAPQVDGAIPAALASGVQGITGAGWTIDLEARKLTLRGRIHLDEATRGRLKAIFGNGSPPPVGVRAIDREDAVLSVYVSADAAGALATLAPHGSELRSRLDAAFGRARSEIDIDVEKDIVPLLTGHGAAAIGLASLAGAELRAILTAPSSYLWTVAGLGATDPKKLADVVAKLDSTLAAQGLEAVSREVEGNTVRVVRVQTHEGDTARPRVLGESAPAGGAVVFGNEPSQMDRTLSAVKTPGPVLLAGRPGIHIELRFVALAKRLDELNTSALPVLYRPIAGKVLQLLHALDRLTIESQPDAAGLAIETRLLLAPEPASKGP